jgi:flagellar hook protein FlgE
MLRSMNSAITGLKMHQMFMDVIGNNIANVNTNAFKSGRITFQNLLNQTIRSAVAPTEARGGINQVQVGTGVSVAGVETVNTQGGFNTTSKVTDLAIQGDGFFVMTDGFQRFYTRDGAFDLDPSGNLVSPNTGLKVSGWMADNGVIDNARPPSGTINIPLGQAVSAKKSSAVELNGNLNGAATHMLATGVVESSTEASGSGASPTLAFDMLDGDTITFQYDGVTYTTLIGDGVAPLAAANGGLSAHSAGSSLGGSTGVEADIELAMNVAVFGIGGTPSVANRDQRKIRVSTIDDGGMVGGEAHFQIMSDKSLEFGNAPSNNLSLSAALRNREAPGLEVVNTVVQVYDSLGNAHDITLKFEKVLKIEDADPNSATFGTMIDSADTWQWSASGAAIDTSGVDPTQVPPNNQLGGGWGYVKFDPTGVFRSVETRSLISPAPLVGPFTTIAQGSRAVVQFDWGNGQPTTVGSFPTNNGAADNQIVAFDFSKISELQDGNTVGESKNDGFATGTLLSFVIGSDGVVLGQYSNGKTNPLAQIALATFPNVAGLTQVGSNMFVESANSGLAAIGTARTAGRGSVNAGQLEMSNVDLAAQFTDMIRAQRGFQANSRIITTSDEMLQDLVNLKR